MKYSLRSLMTFSIWDIALVMLAIGLAIGWLVDHTTLTAKQAARDAAWEKAVESLGIQLISPRGDSPLVEVTVETPHGPLRIFKVPKSQAPAPNPPKP